MIDIPKVQAAILRGEKCAPKTPRRSLERTKRRSLQWDLPFATFNPLPCPLLPRSLAEVHITPRQLEVLQLLARGKHDREIAEGLGINQRTVKAHLSIMYVRTGLETGHKRALLAQAFLELSAAMPILQL